MCTLVAAVLLLLDHRRARHALTTILDNDSPEEVTDLVDDSRARVVLEAEGRLVGVHAPGAQDSKA